MPKKKTRDPRAGKGRVNPSDSDDESVFNDGASAISGFSEASTIAQNDPLNSNSDDNDGSSDTNADEVFEDKLRDAMDMAGQKSANGRVNALKALQQAFAKKLVPDFVEDRVATLGDISLRSLKKGKAEEQIQACRLAVFAAIQLAGSETAEEIWKELQPVLAQGMADNSGNAKARAAMANALGLLCFVASPDLNEYPTQMEAFQKVFAASYSNQNAAAKFSEDTLHLHTAALNSWTLLLTMLNSRRAMDLLATNSDNFGRLLESPDVDLRIAAGEALAVLFEMASEFDEDKAFGHVEELLDLIKRLSTDSQKHRSKKDRKEQKSTFRDIYRYIEDGEDFYEKHACSGNRETLELVCWSHKIHYDAICGILGSGTQTHLAGNELLRDIFELGPPLPSVDESYKPSKQERRSANQIASKWRTQTRGKNRDKRSAVIH